MLNQFVKTLKEKCHLSDGKLRVLTKSARAAELWCTSGVVFWGGAVVLGLAALGLQAVGVPIPASVGLSSIIFGAFMAAKSVALRHGFRFLHHKGQQEQEKRGLNKPAAAPAKTPAPKIFAAPAAKIAPACRAFNAKAKQKIVGMLATMPHPSYKRDKLKAAGFRIRM